MPAASRLEFPILVYSEEGSWVAKSLLTCTTSVQATSAAAVEEVCRLLVGEIQDALEDARGDLNRALEMVTCPAEPGLWNRFFVNAKPLETACGRARIDQNDLQFVAREAGVHSVA